MDEEIEQENFLGCRNGCTYFLIGKDIYKEDISNKGIRWYSTKTGFYASLLAYGLLYNKNGEKIPIEKIKEKIKNG